MAVEYFRGKEKFLEIINNKSVDYPRSFDNFIEQEEIENFQTSITLKNNNVEYTLGFEYLGGFWKEEVVLESICGQFRSLFYIDRKIIQPPIIKNN